MKSATYRGKIKVFSLDGSHIGHEKKPDFYRKLRAEHAKTGKVTKKAQTIRLLLLNSEGKIFLTRRSEKKDENRGLFDKTLGGHVRKDESPEYAVLRSSSEELEFPAVVLDADDFNEAIRESNLMMFAAVRELASIRDFNARYRYADGSETVFPQITTVYIGVYNGPVRFEDAEMDVIELFDLEELIAELKRRPEKYTNDLHVLVKTYKREIKGLITQLKDYNKSKHLE